MMEKSYWMGFMSALASYGLFQDLLGLEGYMKYLQDKGNWVDLHPIVWFTILVVLVIHQRYDELKRKH